MEPIIRYFCTLILRQYVTRSKYQHYEYQCHEKKKASKSKIIKKFQVRFRMISMVYELGL